MALTYDALGSFDDVEAALRVLEPFCVRVNENKFDAACAVLPKAARKHARTLLDEIEIIEALVDGSCGLSVDVVSFPDGTEAVSLGNVDRVTVDASEEARATVANAAANLLAAMGAEWVSTILLD